ncbi:hypothetical protein NBRC116188_04940 [Oceaniserpentilla sp. 4NH20-0058]|uniref:response regulator n=1 Tax=Oceaniserpentilla sp. 4NH20-0058 TaxID=3127660 RepID=UPI0031047902
MISAPVNPEFEGLHILVVEDNPINYMVIEQYLLKMGCVIKWGDTGEKGFELFKEHRFHCVFMDCMLPGMSGLECTEHIRHHEKNNQLTATPVIALTADIRDSNRTACMECGMNDFLGKPFKFNDLTHMLNLWVNPKNPKQKSL